MRCNSDRVAPAAMRAFTLMEVLLVLVMMVLILGAVSLWVQRGVLTSSVRLPQEVFYTAAAEARILALNEGKPVRLQFDSQAQGFRLSVITAADAVAEVAAALDAPLPWEGLERSSRWQRGGQGDGSGWGAAQAADGEATTAARADRFFPLGAGEYQVTFYRLYGEEGVLLEQPLTEIIYHPSGVSTPVEVLLEERSGTGFTQILQPDNFAASPRLGGASGGASPATGSGGWR